jgi:hypothetical protein
MDVPHRFSTIFSSSTHHCNTTQFRGCTVKYSPPYADKPQLSLMNACRKEYFQLRISMATYNFQSWETVNELLQPLKEEASFI